MSKKNFLIFIGIILLAYYILKKFSNLFENKKEKLINWYNKEEELSDWYNKEEELSDWYNKERSNYNSAHLDVNTNESEYTQYKEKDEFEGVGYY